MIYGIFNNMKSERSSPSNEANLFYTTMSWFASKWLAISFTQSVNALNDFFLCSEMPHMNRWNLIICHLCKLKAIFLCYVCVCRVQQYNSWLNLRLITCEFTSKSQKQWRWAYLHTCARTPFSRNRRLLKFHFSKKKTNKKTVICGFVLKTHEFECHK